jgi:hypothetical protein
MRTLRSLALPSLLGLLIAACGDTAGPSVDSNSISDSGVSSGATTGSSGAGNTVGGSSGSGTNGPSGVGSSGVSSTSSSSSGASNSSSGSSSGVVPDGGPPSTNGAQGEVPVNPVTKAIKGSARTFNVSNETEMLAVPWATLGAGDVVNVQYSPIPYKVKIGLRAKGTAANPVVINGVTDANGRRPVFDFTGAKTAPSTQVGQPIFSSTPDYGESLGGIVIIRGVNDPWGSYKPGFIKIANLELRGAKNGSTYMTTAGRTETYGAAAAVYVARGADITLENLIISNNSFGVFTMAKGDAILEAAERITLRNSRFVDNGIPGSYFEHGVYMQADSPIVEGNYFGKVIAGSEGSSFKDRSARLIFRNNYVVSSSRAIDLVHSEEQKMGIEALPYYGTDYVYDNTIINDSAYEAIHFGGDNLGEQEGGNTVFTPSIKYRSTLYFWNNTVKHTSAGYRNIAFGLSLKSTTVHAWNNRFEFGPQAMAHSWVEYAGILNLYQSNTVVGAVKAGGRDGSNPSMIQITMRNEPSPIGFISP